MSEIPSGGFWPSVTRGSLPKEAPDLPADAMDATDLPEGETEVDPSAAGAPFLSLLSSLTTARPIVVVSQSSGEGSEAGAKDANGEAAAPAIGEALAVESPASDRGALSSNAVGSGGLGLARMGAVVATTPASVTGLMAVTPTAATAASLPLGPAARGAGSSETPSSATPSSATPIQSTVTGASGVASAAPIGAAKATPIETSSLASATTQSAEAGSTVIASPSARIAAPTRLGVSAPPTAVSARVETRDGVTHVVVTPANVPSDAPQAMSESPVSPVDAPAAVASTPSASSARPAAPSTPAVDDTASGAVPATTNKPNLSSAPPTNAIVPPSVGAAQPSHRRTDGQVPVPPASREVAPAVDPPTVITAPTMLSETQVPVLNGTPAAPPRTNAQYSEPTPVPVPVPTESLTRVVEYGSTDSLALTLDAGAEAALAEVPPFVPTEAVVMSFQGGATRDASASTLPAVQLAEASTMEVAPVTSSAPDIAPATADGAAVESGDLFHWAEAEAQGAPIRLSELFLSPASRRAREPETVAIVRVPASLAKPDAPVAPADRIDAGSSESLAVPNLSAFDGAAAAEAAEARHVMTAIDTSVAASEGTEVDPSSRMPATNASTVASRPELPSSALPSSTAPSEDGASNRLADPSEPPASTSRTMLPRAARSEAPATPAIEARQPKQETARGVASFERAPLGEGPRAIEESAAPTQPTPTISVQRAAVEREPVTSVQAESPVEAPEPLTDAPPPAQISAPIPSEERTPIAHRAPQVASGPATIASAEPASLDRADTNIEAPPTSMNTEDRKATVSSSTTSPTPAEPSLEKPVAAARQPILESADTTAAVSRPRLGSRESEPARNEVPARAQVPSPRAAIANDSVSVPTRPATVGTPARRDAPQSTAGGFASNVDAAVPSNDQTPPSNGARLTRTPQQKAQASGAVDRSSKPEPQADPAEQPAVAAPRVERATGGATSSSPLRTATSQPKASSNPAPGTIAAANPEAAPSPLTKSSKRSVAKPSGEGSVSTKAPVRSASSAGETKTPANPGSAPNPSLAPARATDTASTQGARSTGSPHVVKPAANTAETREPLVDLHHSAQAAGSASKLTKSSPIAESATAESPRDASAAPAQEATAAHSEIAAAQPDRLDPAALGTNTTSATGGTSDAAPARVATTTLSPRELPERFPSVVRLALDEGRREARIQLMPPDLGAIQVRLRVNGRSVHAQMTVEREEVRALVEGLRKELSDQMEKSGLKLERLDVATSLVATTFDPNVVSAPSSQAPTMQAQSNGRNGERAADGDSQSARRERGDGRMPEAMPPEKRAERRENSRGVDVRV